MISKKRGTFALRFPLSKTSGETHSPPPVDMTVFGSFAGYPRNDLLWMSEHCLLMAIDDVRWWSLGQRNGTYDWYRCRITDVCESRSCASSVCGEWTHQLADSDPAYIITPTFCKRICSNCKLLLFWLFPFFWGVCIECAVFLITFICSKCAWWWWRWLVMTNWWWWWWWKND